MAYDYSKLKGKIVEKFSTQSKFAQALGISERSLSCKLNEKIDWRQSEIVAAMELLGIKENEVELYFFTQKVQNI